MSVWVSGLFWYKLSVMWVFLCRDQLVRRELSVCHLSLLCCLFIAQHVEITSEREFENQRACAMPSLGRRQKVFTTKIRNPVTWDFWKKYVSQRTWGFEELLWIFMAVCLFLPLSQRVCETGGQFSAERRVTRVEEKGGEITYRDFTF